MVYKKFQGLKLSVLGFGALRLPTLENADTNYDPAWAFRFLQSIPNICVILSGMSSFAQTTENIKTFEMGKPLNDKEFNTLLAIADSMVKQSALPCTACRYCVSHCPQTIKISEAMADFAAKVKG